MLWHIDFGTISERDLDALVDAGVPEGLQIEYKEALPGSGNRREFLEDVSSFANAAGGDILYGVVGDRDTTGRSTGRPIEIRGLDGLNADEEILRMENRLRDGVDPRLPGIRIREIIRDGRTSVLLIRVPRSWAQPHGVLVDGGIRVCGRTSAGKYPMNLSEMKAAILRSNAIGDRIRGFRRDRILLLESGEGPAQFALGGILVIHIIPFGVFDSGLTRRDSSFWQVAQEMSEVRGGVGSSRFNLDGLLLSTELRVAEPTQGYAQIFATGLIEYAAVFNVDQLPSVAFEEWVMNAVRKSLGFYGRRGVVPPVAILLGLLRCRGLRMSPNPRSYLGESIDRDRVLVPEVVCEDFSADIPRLLQPAFDVIWNAAGIPRSMNYDLAGDWKPR